MLFPQKNELFSINNTNCFCFEQQISIVLSGSHWKLE